MNSWRIKTALLLILFSVQLICQEPGNRNILILPFASNGIDQVNIKTSQSLLNFELNKAFSLDKIVVIGPMDDQDSLKCFEEDCAVNAGREQHADEVVGVNMLMLGERIVVQYFLVDVNENNVVLRDQITASNLEDLEVVMKRVAKSIINRASITENVEVGAVTEKESAKPLRRGSTRNFGISFGYTFPQSGYGSKERSFTFDVRGGYEMDDYAVGMLLGLRKGFALNIYSDYLFYKTDFSPYFGASFGFHWVLNEDHFFGEDKRGDGFEVGLRTGIRAFRTYSFEVLLNLEYVHTFNDFNSNAIVFTIGLL